MSVSSSLKADVKEFGADDAEEDAAAGVDELLEMLLTGVVVFSRGLPCLSKKLSAHSATSFAVLVSTALPIISLILAGMVLSRCSFLISSISTSLVSSTS